uniref:polyphosphoinositide phosphatase n=1 Tax=Ciona intestinalis TaxID=7719 RepID=UPI00005238F2|nr:polyphosphoinositide phosphatase [Ciona intestinalis]|eukprot:XP_002125633.1 polyphosphoinositide phosphatase [Ciona intestinalis]
MDDPQLDIVQSKQFCFKIKWIQKIKIYKTHTRFYVIGSNNAETKYRILKIDRTDPWQLNIIDDGVDYTACEVQDILYRLHVGNSTTLINKSLKRGLVESYKGFGIVGFIRFKEGYYLILITKRIKVAEIGGHSIYKIEDTSMINIPNSNVKVTHPEEWRYLRSFQTVDLSSNFYYSHSYDLTNNLQHNFMLLHHNRSDDVIKRPKLWQTHGRDMKPCKRFVWNNYLLDGLQDDHITDIWVLYVIHGHIDQSCVSVYGKSIYITLIGRRSSSYAGTRFLKRGCNVKGDVGNEVETEQIVHCATSSSLHHTPFTSYVQHRGSVPCQWFQDITASVVPSKPPITITSDNPYAQPTSLHFQQLLERFGSPVVVLNLVRKREKRFHESVLGIEFSSAINYLNQFLSTKQQIKYHAFDMAHSLRGTKLNVLAWLANIAEHSIQATGFFQSKPDLYKDTLNKDHRWRTLGGQRLGSCRVQTGVLRTNCVDCLDRTNSAQFVAGNCALAYQLYSLGVLDEPAIEIKTDVTRLYEEMFETHGDIIALQYGGSQLVHTINSYRRTVAPWASHSRDIVTTLSRYYTNTFSDADKQSAINLFLGVFRPQTSESPMWELPTDHYLHNNNNDVLSTFSPKTYTDWLSSDVQRTLPLPKEMIESVRKLNSATDEACHGVNTTHCDDCVDWYQDTYRPDQLTVFDECFSLNMTSTATRSGNQNDISPFAVRDFSWQSRGDLDKKPNRPASVPQSSDVSSNGTSDSGEFESPKIPTHDRDRSSKHVQSHDLPWLHPPRLKDFSPSSVYGIEENKMISQQDIDVYERYVKFKSQETFSEALNFAQDQLFTSPPSVDQQSLRIYKESVTHTYHVDRQYYVDYVNQFKQ